MKVITQDSALCSMNHPELSNALAVQPPKPCLALQKLEQLQNQNQALEQQIAELQKQLRSETTLRQQAEVDLQELHAALEARLAERSAAWEQVTQQLLIEIAERKRAEDTLKRTNEQLHAVLDAVPGPVTWISSDLQYQGVNRHAAATFDTPAEAFISQKVGFLNSSPQFSQFVQQLFASDEKMAAQEMISDANGVSRSYLIVGQKYCQNQTAVFVGTDITQLKQVEAELRHSLQRLSDFKYALEQATMLSIADFQGVITYVNDKFCEVSQYSSQELVGQTYRLVNSGYHSPEFFRELWETITRGRIWRGELQNKAKDGTCYWVDTTIAPLLDDTGKSYHFLAIQTEITDRKRTEADVQRTLEKEQELSNLKSRFISMTSHEFRTPLTVIASSAGILKDFGHKLSEDQKQKHLQCIQNYVKHAIQLLDDILLINRIDAEKLSFEPELLNLIDFCRLLLGDMQLHAPNHEIIFLTDGRPVASEPDSSFSVYMDKKLLRQILVNLLSNAIKFSASGSAIQVNLLMQTDGVIVEITDSGIGIPLNDQPHIFQSFHRGSNIDTAPGNGLGLAIVKKCLDIHGGNVTFRSDVGAGTTFTVFLPLHSTTA